MHLPNLKTTFFYLLLFPFHWVLCSNVVTIDQVLQHAAYDSPEMLEARLSIAQSNADRLRGWVTYLPQISMSYQVGGTHEIRKSINPSDATRYGGSYSVSASHPLYHWGAIAARRELGFSQETIAEKQGVIKFAQMIPRIRASYGQLVVKKNALTLLEKKIENKTLSLEKSQTLLEMGRKSANEVAQLSLELRSHQLEKKHALNLMERDLVNFRNETGFLDLTVDQIPNDLELPEHDIANLESEYMAFKNERFKHSLPQSIANEHHRSIKNQLIIVNASEKPTFNFGFGMSQAPVEVNNKYEISTNFSTGITGSWTLFDRDESKSNKRSLLLRKRQVDMQLETTRSRLFAEGKHLLESLISSNQAYKLRIEQLKLTEEALATAQSNFERGDINQEDLHTTELKVLEVKNSVLTDKVNLLNAYYSFLGTIFMDTAIDYFDPKDQRL